MVDIINELNNLRSVLNQSEWTNHFLEVAENLNDEQESVREEINTLYAELCPDFQSVYNNVLFNPLEYSMNGIMLKNADLEQQYAHNANANHRLYPGGESIWFPNENKITILLDDTNFYTGSITGKEYDQERSVTSAEFNEMLKDPDVGPQLRFHLTNMRWMKYSAENAFRERQSVLFHPTQLDTEKFKGGFLTMPSYQEKKILSQDLLRYVRRGLSTRDTSAARLSQRAKLRDYVDQTFEDERLKNDVNEYMNIFFQDDFATKWMTKNTEYDRKTEVEKVYNHMLAKAETNDDIGVQGEKLNEQDFIFKNGKLSNRLRKTISKTYFQPMKKKNSEDIQSLLLQRRNVLRGKTKNIDSRKKLFGEQLTLTKVFTNKQVSISKKTLVENMAAYSQSSTGFIVEEQDLSRLPGKEALLKIVSENRRKLTKLEANYRKLNEELQNALQFETEVNKQLNKLREKEQILKREEQDEFENSNHPIIGSLVIKEIRKIYDETYSRDYYSPLFKNTFSDLQGNTTYDFFDPFEYNTLPDTLHQAIRDTYAIPKEKIQEIRNYPGYTVNITVKDQDQKLVLSNFPIMPVIRRLIESITILETSNTRKFRPEVLEYLATLSLERDREEWMIKVERLFYLYNNMMSVLEKGESAYRTTKVYEDEENARQIMDYIQFWGVDLEDIKSRSNKVLELEEKRNEMLRFFKNQYEIQKNVRENRYKQEFDDDILDPFVFFSPNDFPEDLQYYTFNDLNEQEKAQFKDYIVKLEDVDQINSSDDMQVWCQQNPKNDAYRPDSGEDNLFACIAYCQFGKNTVEKRFFVRHTIADFLNKNNARDRGYGFEEHLVAAAHV